VGGGGGGWGGGGRWGGGGGDGVAVHSGLGERINVGKKWGQEGLWWAKRLVFEVAGVHISGAKLKWRQAEEFSRKLLGKRGGRGGIGECRKLVICDPPVANGTHAKRVKRWDMQGREFKRWVEIQKNGAVNSLKLEDKITRRVAERVLQERKNCDRRRDLKIDGWGL